MCCTSHSPKSIAKKVVRIGFGLAIAFVGFAHYQDPTFAESVSRGLGVLEPLGMVWGYVLPGLFILGGLLLAFNIYLNVAAYVTAIALASIPAGLMLKSAIGGISLGDTMPPAMNALVWIVVLIMVMKKECCGPDGCCTDNNCDVPASKPAMKSMPTMPMATKAPAKKKKSGAKKRR